MGCGASTVAGSTPQQTPPRPLQSIQHAATEQPTLPGPAPAATLRGRNQTASPRSGNNAAAAAGVQDTGNTSSRAIAMLATRPDVEQRKNSMDEVARDIADEALHWIFAHSGMRLNPCTESMEAARAFHDTGTRPLCERRCGGLVGANNGPIEMPPSAERLFLAPVAAVLNNVKDLAWLVLDYHNPIPLLWQATIASVCEKEEHGSGAPTAAHVLNAIEQYHSHTYLAGMGNMGPLPRRCLVRLASALHWRRHDNYFEDATLAARRGNERYEFEDIRDIYVYLENPTHNHRVFQGYEEFFVLGQLYSGHWFSFHCFSGYYSGYWDGYSVKSTVSNSLAGLEKHGTGFALTYVFELVASAVLKHQQNFAGIAKACWKHLKLGPRRGMYY